MIQVERQIELTRLLWQMRDGKITEFRLELQPHERSDHLASKVETFARRQKIRLDAFTKRGRRMFCVVRLA